MGIELIWPAEAAERLRAEVYAVVHDVVSAGGAVGYLSPPGRAQTDSWLDSTLKCVRAGDAALAVACVDGVVAATGVWRRGGAAVFARRAELQQVMAHPRFRGRGLGRLVVEGLVSSACAAGIEVLSLGTRGNNHGAIALYESLGFRECGRMPNAIAVGDERWDDVCMYLPLGYPSGTVLRGSG